MNIYKLEYPILIINGFLEKEEFKKIIKYANHVLYKNRLNIFVFNDFDSYIEFREKVMKEPLKIETENRNSNTNKYNIERCNGEIIIDNGNTKYRVRIDIIFFMLKELLKNKEIDIDYFEKVLKDKGIIDNDISLRDKKNGVQYVKYWIAPFLFLNHVSKEDPDIYIFKKKKNNKYKVILYNPKNLDDNTIKEKIKNYIISL